MAKANVEVTLQNLSNKRQDPISQTEIIASKSKPRKFINQQKKNKPWENRESVHVKRINTTEIHSRYKINHKAESKT